MSQNPANLSADAADLVSVWRGNLIECVHRGHAVVCDAQGAIRHQWGAPDTIVYPRSSAKMIQALPLIESGAADAFGLTAEQLALACASHIGAHYHTDKVQAWLADLGLTDDDFRCGAHMPEERAARDALIRENKSPCQYHNNCSGKHCGFLTLTKHLGAGPEYLDLDHPVQRAILAAYEDVCGETSPGYGIDGCSAPNFAASLRGIATAMARFATARQGDNARASAQVRLREAMIAHPELVAGHDRACTELMRACDGRAAIKGGAEGFYVAILPDLGLGVALKIVDGAKRGSESAIAAILNKLGVLPDGHPALGDWMRPEQHNWRGLLTGRIEPMF